ncbi:hypothetical protein KP509_14G001700 [Ceratopteris richardii]|uniref:PRELI/MSF1 domain-containing protein n=1 Tax=Ceratopteris richardii TaxID=49495 RepID=A0A8T2T700_CERRI|nr:hypothetical protein KP509_14G001700 [Ceratopteris richardii]KAH7414609.1 hypothetical protein KP509_14G001700 [Ceratopteris richardii]KAH7414610.1 hypothetical protein KP509_14G001700 [Ceratopteris richardii]KAH7414611.1 hypothetical protein KP509_14G001700 [Ceratopteris richardii]
MVRRYTQEHTFLHPWGRVTAACWRKYTDPENRTRLSHILDVDTLDRKLDSLNGRLLTKRAITVNAPGPWWLQKIVGESVCHCIEESTVDAGKKSMEIVTRNVTLKNFVSVEEKCWYSPHPENSDWTILRQETSISCHTFSALASMAEKIEQRCVEKFQQNSVKGREVMENLCTYLEAEANGIGVRV